MPEDKDIPAPTPEDTSRSVKPASEENPETSQPKRWVWTDRRIAVASLLLASISFIFNIGLTINANSTNRAVYEIEREQHNEAKEVLKRRRETNAIALGKNLAEYFAQARGKGRVTSKESEFRAMSKSQKIWGGRVDPATKAKIADNLRALDVMRSEVGLMRVAADDSRLYDWQEIGRSVEASLGPDYRALYERSFLLFVVQQLAHESFYKADLGDNEVDWDDVFSICQWLDMSPDEYPKEWKGFKGLTDLAYKLQTRQEGGKLTVDGLTNQSEVIRGDTMGLLEDYARPSAVYPYDE